MTTTEGRDQVTRAIMVLEWDEADVLDFDHFPKVMDKIKESLDGELQPTVCRMAIREVADRVVEIFDEEERKAMGIIKHGEGSILPENEQQKTAQQQGEMSEEARAELAEENERADGGHDE